MNHGSQSYRTRQAIQIGLQRRDFHRTQMTRLVATQQIENNVERKASFFIHDDIPSTSHRSTKLHHRADVSFSVTGDFLKAPSKLRPRSLAQFAEFMILALDNEPVRLPLRPLAKRDRLTCRNTNRERHAQRRGIQAIDVNLILSCQRRGAAQAFLPGLYTKRFSTPSVLAATSS